MQCDASSTGLGACLLQEGRPVAYASRALTECETRYAQIEREMLAIVFAAERFSNYIYGREIEVQSDHRPLETITKKSLHTASPRLQTMMLRLMRYNLHVKYTPGSQMYIADTLSRAYMLDQSDMNNDDDEAVLRIM
ncbi:retrovirus-related pol polyprotein from transposon 297-like protein [Plakobranchus ocellatus]|uniref:Retrovirus-related pol polyprotein from transposon 297-like protein n=1 Tax=Plakobranchus ocellatus TaxID=259542 RepID=A0AAV3YUH6_9GAST|nr:retrovirus-related pol polyprotein from transposon 297-like protein [Plakobranchus ocellatus]